MPERVRFTLDGRHQEGEHGVSLLAALWNAGARELRAAVSGGARGPLCGMGSCFECRVSVDGEAHVRACLAPLREGASVSLAGRQEPRPPREAVEAEPLEAKVVVVGGGPAGLAAAVHAAESGARTLLVDQNARPGGQIWRHRGAPPRAASAWIARLARSAACVLDAAVVDAGPRELVVDHAGSLRRVRFERLVLATGARELYLPFPGWTLPGVVGAGGAQALLKAGASFRGRRVVVAGSGPLSLAVASALAGKGARVVGVAEQAPLARLAAFAAGLWGTPGKLLEGLGYRARLGTAPYRAGAWVREVEQGGALRARLTDGRRDWSWDCDVLATGYGLVPNLELPRLLGCAVADGRVVTTPAQETSLSRVYAAGELCGVAGVDHALASGTLAGLAAAGCDPPGSLVRRCGRERAFGRKLARAFALRHELRALPRPDTLVCRCEDVPHGRLVACASSREAKLATRAGMGACQGRVCGPALEYLRGWEADSVRPPLVPTALELLAATAPEGGPQAARTGRGDEL
jgi:NADPH-dependent 2,4-dienoyl-CoA reductase/sulfur reductase-like enzyme